MTIVQREPLPFPAGEERYLRIPGWRSELLAAPHDLFLYFPKAYHREPERRFPVLLLHDGQNLFDGELSYVKGSTWRAGIAADQATEEGAMPPVILAGIGNAGAERMLEYTPFQDSRLGGGRGSLYARMLVDDLLPELRAHYRIALGPGCTGIAGASLGGLISLWTALAYPQIFGKAGVLSPSLWWNDRAMLQTVSALGRKPDLRIWLDMGSAEGAPHVRDTEALAQLLEQKGWRNGHDLAFNIIPDGTHSETSWAARFGDVLRFLFAPA